MITTIDKIKELENELLVQIHNSNYNDLEMLESEINQHRKELEKIYSELIRNKHFRFISLNGEYKVEFEEIVNLDTTYGCLKYNIYINKNGIKELILGNIIAEYIYEDLEPNKYHKIHREIYKEYDNNLTRKEKDAIWSEVQQFKDNAKLREIEIRAIIEDNERRRRKNVVEKVKPQMYEQNKDTLKSFYRILAKNFHPDIGGDDKSMQVLTELKRIWGV